MKNVLKIAILGFLTGCTQLIMPAAANAPTKFDTNASEHNHISMGTPIADFATAAQPSMTANGTVLTGDEVLTGEITITFNPNPTTNKTNAIKVTIPAVLKHKLATAPAPKDQKTAASIPVPTFSAIPASSIEITAQSSSGNNSPAPASPYNSSSQTRLLNPSRLKPASSAAAAIPVPVRNNRADSSPTIGGRAFTTLPQTTAAAATTATVATVPSVPAMTRSSSPVTTTRSASPKALCSCDGFSCMLTCGKCSCGPCCKPNDVMNFASIATATTK